MDFIYLLMLVTVKSRSGFMQRDVQELLQNTSDFFFLDKCVFALRAACLQLSPIQVTALPSLKRLTCHYALQWGYHSCDYPHISPCKMYCMAHLGA